jgi:hypothetical protein
MLDDSLMAEMFGIILEGVKDGGQNAIEKLYRKYDDGFPEKKTLKAVDLVLNRMSSEFDDVLLDSAIANAPHFLMFFAAVAHATVVIPIGDMDTDMPQPNTAALSKLNIAKENLEMLNEVLESTEPVVNMLEFWTASASSTQRIKSRRVRFPIFWRALLPKRM